MRVLGVLLAVSLTAWALMANPAAKPITPTAANDTFVVEDRRSHDDGEQAPDPHADDWYQEKFRPKSGALNAYESAAEDINSTIGLANASLTCGLISNDRYENAVRGAEDYRNSPAIMRLRMRLEGDDRGAAGRYDQIVADSVARMNIGDAKQPMDKGCQDFADRAAQNPALLP